MFLYEPCEKDGKLIAEPKETNFNKMRFVAIICEITLLSISLSVI